MARFDGKKWLAEAVSADDDFARLVMSEPFIKAFNAGARAEGRGEAAKRRAFRKLLDQFGFDMDAYTRAQYAARKSA